MLVYGSGEGRSVMGELPEQTCPSCGRKTPRTALCVWNYGHLWYLCSFITKRSYRTVCESCGAVAEYSRADARAAGLNHNIPFMKRKGWLLCAAAALVVVFIAVMGNIEDEKRLREMIGAPAGGDIYMANLARIPGSGYKPGKAMYGSMVLLGRDDDGRFLVATSNSAWDKKAGLQRNWDDLEYSVSQLDNGDPLTLSQEELAGYLGSGVIYDGRRGEEAKMSGGAPEEESEPEEEAETEADAEAAA